MKAKRWGMDSGSGEVSAAAQDLSRRTEQQTFSEAGTVLAVVNVSREADPTKAKNIASGKGIDPVMQRGGTTLGRIT